MAGRKVMVVNMDEDLKAGLENCLKESGYLFHPSRDALEQPLSPVLLKIIKEAKAGDYSFIFFNIAGLTDYILVEEAKKIASGIGVIAVTKEDPRNHVDVGEKGRMTLKDYLYKLGADLVVYRKDLYEDIPFLPLCLDSMLDPATLQINAAPYCPNP